MAYPVGKATVQHSNNSTTAFAVGNTAANTVMLSSLNTGMPNVALGNQQTNSGAVTAVASDVTYSIGSFGAFVAQAWPIVEPRYPVEWAPYLSILCRELEAVARGERLAPYRPFMGYAGWGPGQLEDEIARNGWITVNAQPELIFETPIEQRYERALGLLGISQMMLSHQAGHA